MCLGVIHLGKGRAVGLHLTQHPLTFIEERSYYLGQIHLLLFYVCTSGGSLKAADSHINFV